MQEAAFGVTAHTISQRNLPTQTSASYRASTHGNPQTDLSGFINFTHSRASARMASRRGEIVTITLVTAI